VSATRGNAGRYFGHAGAARRWILSSPRFYVATAAPWCFAYRARFCGIELLTAVVIAACFGRAGMVARVYRGYNKIARGNAVRARGEGEEGEEGEESETRPREKNLTRNRGPSKL